VVLVRDLKAVGIESRKALAIGDTVGYYSAAGTTGSDSTPTSDSIIWVNGSSGANAGVSLPSLDASNNKRHLVLNDTAGNIRVYVKHDSGDLLKVFGGGSSGTAGDPYLVIPAGEWYEIVKMDSASSNDPIWVALT